MNLKFLMLIMGCGITVLTGCDNPTATKTTEQKPTTAASSSSSTTPSKNPDYPTYIATTDASNAPYEIRDEKGNVAGFDVDLIQAIAKEAKFNVEVIPAAWDGIFDSLNSGERHILIAPLTITPERLQQVDFSIPYIYPTRTAYLTQETADRLGIKTYADLPKGTISAKVNTSNMTSLIADFGEPNLKLVPADSQFLAFKNMVSKQSDVAFGDTAVMQYHSKSTPNQKFVTIEQPLAVPVQAGFAVKKGNKELAEKINTGLKKAVADGTYKTLAIKWFGQELGTKIADRTAANIDNPTLASMPASSAK